MLPALTAREIPAFSNELKAESKWILSFWMKNTIDEINGGFIGSLDNSNRVIHDSPKGIVLNSRILWTFSAAYLNDNNPEYLAIAKRAFTYISDHFIDHESGGVYWSVDSEGKILENKKQVYGNAFCIYGMAEYYKASSDERALSYAKNLFQHIESHCFDEANGGYIEAFDKNWQPLTDLRLSEKDQNDKKTMNTHLHLIEAYANLYTYWEHPLLYDRIIHLLEVFKMYFIDPETHHLRLFMDETWQSRSALISFGHDIEASWLLLECATTIKNEPFIRLYRELSIELALAASRGLDVDGSLWYEFDAANDQLVREKHWWPQAEAMVGFINAWQLTDEEPWFYKARSTWDWIKKYLKDEKHGEWHWGINADGTAMEKEKAGFWKCPYHSVRACLVIVNRLNNYHHPEKPGL